MATKKTAADGAAKKASKKAASAETKTAKKSTKKAAPAATVKPAKVPRKTGPRGPKVSADNIREALAGGPQNVGTIAERFGASKHAVRKALKEMGPAVEASGKTVDRTYKLAS